MNTALNYAKAADRERHPFRFMVNDHDAEHTLENGYHVFPATAEQLRTLREQIDVILGVAE